MNMNNYLPTRLLTGVGVIDEYSHVLKELGDKCLIVTGKTSARLCGAFSDVKKALDKECISYVLFDDISQNPKIDECLKAASIAAIEHVDFIIGIGGGSPMDASKCIAVLASDKHMDEEELYSLKWTYDPLPIVTVGTTAGTGSEVTKVSVITNSKGFKKSFKDDRIYPTVSFGDHRYTEYMSDYFTRSTAIDALAHSMESYFNKEANELSRMYAVRSIQLLLPVFKKIMTKGTDRLSLHDREILYQASIYGGMAINTTGTALPHTAGYLLTEDYDIPHGIACAVFLPVFYQLNKDYNEKEVNIFLQRIYSTEEEFLTLIQAMIPDYHVSMSMDDVHKNHYRWMNNASINKCLMPVLADKVDKILIDMFVE